MADYRLKRVQNLLCEHISGMIMRGVIKDPRINTFLSITEIKVSKDLSYADIYISSLEGQHHTETGVEALGHASGFIQHKLRRLLRLRTTPILRFHADAGIEYGYDMSRKLDEIASELSDEADTPVSDTDDTDETPSK